jgi:hypothetical protein
MLTYYQPIWAEMEPVVAAFSVNRAPPDWDTGSEEVHLPEFRMSPIAP